jgi:hypothetical protein
MPTAPVQNIHHFKTILLTFFVGNFCLPQYGYMRIRVHNTDLPRFNEEAESKEKHGVETLCLSPGFNPSILRHIGI